MKNKNKYLNNQEFLQISRKVVNQNRETTIFLGLLYSLFSKRLQINSAPMASYEVFHTFEIKVSHRRNKSVIGVKLFFHTMRQGETHHVLKKNSQDENIFISFTIHALMLSSNLTD